jgi:hypothetical protein
MNFKFGDVIKITHPRFKAGMGHPARSMPDDCGRDQPQAVDLSFYALFEADYLV